MLTFFYVLQQGQHHAEKQLPCQDFCKALRMTSNNFGSEIILAAVADGVSSCEYSQDGAKCAVESSLSFLERELLAQENLNDDAVTTMLRQSFHIAKDNVEALSSNLKIPYPEFDSTLTVAIYDGVHLWFGHIGDDGIVVLYNDGSYEMITSRHQGEFAHSVFPLRSQERWEFGKASKSVASLVMMTDGVLDYCVDTEAMGNRVYFPFLEPALTTCISNDFEAIEVKESWDTFFHGSLLYGFNIREKITDDISFLEIQNPTAVSLLPPVQFDLKKWKLDTIQRRKSIDEELYADFHAYQETQIDGGGKTSSGKTDSRLENNSSFNRQGSNRNVKRKKARKKKRTK